MDTQATAALGRRKWPLYVRVMLGAASGIALGLLSGPSRPLGALPVSSLADVGMLVVRALKIVATPLIFFSVLDAILSSDVRPKSAWRLFALAAINATVALMIGLGSARVLESGRGQFPNLRSLTSAATHDATATPTAGPPTSHLASILPESLLEPFRQNGVLGVALIAVLLAVALRVVRSRGPEEASQVETIATLVRQGQKVFVVILGWLIELIPFAVAGVLAAAVARTGLSALKSLGTFSGTMILGLLLQVLVYYGLLVWLVARRSPLAVLRGLADALLTALSCGSSVATLPVTLRCLDRLGVRPASAQLAAAAGTNLNHDGIILYEAAATLFVAQALGMHPSFGEQLHIAGAALMVGIGIAGVPEAGLVTLPLVLAAGGIPAEIIPLVLPLVLPVDWIIGRFRAATNVASDATVAIVLDFWTGPVKGR